MYTPNNIIHVCMYAFVYLCLYVHTCVYFGVVEMVALSLSLSLSLGVCFKSSEVHCFIHLSARFYSTKEG
jgi:hypothetical protein